METSILDAKQLVETRLSLQYPSLKIAFENMQFTPPASQLYLETSFVISFPTDPVFTAGYHRETIIFNVFVVGMLNTGTGTILQKALEVRDLFKKGTTLVKGNTKVHVLTTPRIAGTAKLGDRAATPVLIELIVESYNY